MLFHINIEILYGTTDPLIDYFHAYRFLLLCIKGFLLCTFLINWGKSNWETPEVDIFVIYC